MEGITEPEILKFFRGLSDADKAACINDLRERTGRSTEQ